MKAELNEFFEKQSRILPKGSVGGARRQKVKSMTLGSGNGLVEKESKQNANVIGLLLEEAKDLNEKVNSLGLPIGYLTRKFFGSVQEREKIRLKEEKRKEKEMENKKFRDGSMSDDSFDDAQRQNFGFSTEAAITIDQLGTPDSSPEPVKNKTITRQTRSG